MWDDVLKIKQGKAFIEIRGELVNMGIKYDCDTSDHIEGVNAKVEKILNTGTNKLSYRKAVRK